VKTRRLIPFGTLVAAIALAMGATVGFGGANAQEMDGPHPAHIHSGTCATLGDVVYPLSDVGGPMMDASGTPMAAGMAMGSTAAIPVKASMTTIQADLNTILGAEHAINVHESAENIGNYIACGDLGGEVMGSDLAIGLGELNGSGHSGVAWLHDNGDGTTNVTVFLIATGGGSGAEIGTPAANG
jgi:hypothetical protein